MDNSDKNKEYHQLLPNVQAIPSALNYRVTNENIRGKKSADIIKSNYQIKNDTVTGLKKSFFKMSTSNQSKKRENPNLELQGYGQSTAKSFKQAISDNISNQYINNGQNMIQLKHLYRAEKQKVNNQPDQYLKQQFHQKKEKIQIISYKNNGQRIKKENDGTISQMHKINANDCYSIQEIKECNKENLLQAQKWINLLKSQKNQTEQDKEHICNLQYQYDLYENYGKLLADTIHLSNEEMENIKLQNQHIIEKIKKIIQASSPIQLIENTNQTNYSEQQQILQLTQEQEEQLNQQKGLIIGNNKQFNKNESYSPQMMKDNNVKSKLNGMQLHGKRYSLSIQNQKQYLDNQENQQKTNMPLYRQKYNLNSRLSTDYKDISIEEKFQLCKQLQKGIIQESKESLHSNKKINEYNKNYYQIHDNKAENGTVMKNILLNQKLRSLSQQNESQITGIDQLKHNQEYRHYQSVEKKSSMNNQDHSVKQNQSFHQNQEFQSKSKQTLFDFEKNLMDFNNNASLNLSPQKISINQKTSQRMSPISQQSNYLQPQYNFDKYQQQSGKKKNHIPDQQIRIKKLTTEGSQDNSEQNNNHRNEKIQQLENFLKVQGNRKKMIQNPFPTDILETIQDYQDSYQINYNISNQINPKDVRINNLTPSQKQYYTHYLQYNSPGLTNSRQNKITELIQLSKEQKNRIKNININNLENNTISKRSISYVEGPSYNQNHNIDKNFFQNFKPLRNIINKYNSSNQSLNNSIEDDRYNISLKKQRQCNQFSDLPHYQLEKSFENLQEQYQFQNLQFQVLDTINYQIKNQK